MIGKRIPQNRTKSKATSIRDLTDYIVAENEHEKILAHGARGFVCDGYAEQQAEMIALAHEAVRSKNPVTHYVISWHSDEHPTREQVEEAISIYMATLGLSGHQVIWGLHQDTDNIHLHLAINRVHPETGKCIEINKGFDRNAIHQAIARIEHAQGWRPEKNGRYMVDSHGKIVRRKKQKAVEQPSPGLSQPAADLEHRTGEKSAERIAQEEAASILENARSWPEVHEQLAAKNMRYERQGSGAIVWIGDTPVKASKVSRKGSIVKMQDRIGPFEARGEKPNVYRQHKPAAEKPYPGPTGELSNNRLRRLSECSLAPDHEARKKPSRILSFIPRAGGRTDEDLRRDDNLPRIAPQPIQPNNQLLVEYHTLLAAHKQKRDAAKEELRTRHKAEMGQLLRQQAEQRRTVIEEKNWMNRGELKNALASVLAHEQAKARALLAEQQDKERRKLAEDLPPFPGFEIWLKEQGREDEVEAWKQRLSARKELEKHDGFMPPPATEYVPPTPAQDIRAYAPHVRTDDEVAYVPADAPADAPAAFVDHGAHIEMGREVSNESTLAALQLAQQKWGEVTITGSDEFKAECVKLAVAAGIEIKNPELRYAVEQERQRLAAEAIPGYQPPLAPEPEKIPEPQTKAELEAAKAKLIDERDRIGRDMQGESMAVLMEATRPLNEQLIQIDAQLNKMDRQQRQAEALVKEHEARMQPEPTTQVEALERERDAILRQMDALASKDIPATQMMAENRELSAKIIDVERKIEDARVAEEKAEQQRQAERAFENKILQDGQQMRGTLREPLVEFRGQQYVTLSDGKKERYILNSPLLDKNRGKEVNIQMQGKVVSLMQIQPQNNAINKPQQAKQQGKSGPTMKKGPSMG